MRRHAPVLHWLRDLVRPTALATAFVVLLPAQAEAACDHPSNLCLKRVKGSRWAPGETTTPKERSRRMEENGGTLTLTVENGRGSVFINGRYLGTAPLDGIEIPRGKNDLEVRDGKQVLAKGVLVVSRGNDLEITVNHP